MPFKTLLLINFEGKIINNSVVSANALIGLFKIKINIIDSNKHKYVAI